MSAKTAWLIVPVAAVVGLLIYLDRRSPEIHLAIAKNDLARVNELLDRHPELLESRNRSGRTPLLHAVELNRVEIFHSLIRRGADVNATIGSSSDGEENGLHLAAELDLQEAARTLMRAGTSVNALNRNGQTPWDIANAKEHWNIAGMLDGSGPPDIEKIVRHRAGRVAPVASFYPEVAARTASLSPK